MKKITYILLLILLTFPFGDGIGGGYYALAVSYDVQVPVSSRHNNTYAVYTTSSTRARVVGSGTYFSSPNTINMHTTARQHNRVGEPTCRFTTYVPAIDASGYAHTPSEITAGQSSSSRPHVRRVGHDDDEDDPFMGNVDPIGDVPWWMMALLLLGYAAYRFYRFRSLRVS